MLIPSGVVPQEFLHPIAIAAAWTSEVHCDVNMAVCTATAVLPAYLSTVVCYSGQEWQKLVFEDYPGRRKLS